MAEGVVQGWLYYFAGHACGDSFASTSLVRRLSTLIRKSVFSTDLRQEPYEFLINQPYRNGPVFTLGRGKRRLAS